jgi:iron complex outermembrane recepter protein
MFKAFATAACWGCVLAGGAQVAGAQTAAELAGIVRDATGAVVPGVTVTLTGKTLSAPVAIETDHQGRFAISLSPGLYQVRAVAAGFEPWSADVEVSASGKTLDVPLKMQSLSDRVTVTATRTGTADIQSTPIAITALPARTLEQTEVERIEHLVGLIPTLTISQSAGGTPLLTLRGIGSTGSTMQLDGVYLARSSMRALDFLDVDRVEVLRGPQGTLIGRNSIGGTINVVTRQPTNALEARARLTFGNYDKIRAEGAVSGPLVRNRIMGAFAFLRGSADGFVTDVDHPDHSLGSEDTWAGRGQLRFVFGLRSELLVSGDYARSRGTPLTLARPLAAKLGALPFDIPADFWSVRTSHLAEGRNDQGGAAARLSVQVADSLTLTSLTAYRNADLLILTDSDTTEREMATARVPDKQRQVSQELTLTGRTARLTWISGVFWFDEWNPGGIELTLYPPASQFRGLPTIDASAWALFGQAGYRLSERISLTGGVRYSDEQEQAVINNGTYRLGTSTPLGPIANFVDSTSDDAWTPKASIELRTARDTFVYISATRGFKSGGVNITAVEPGGAFRPELAWSYETGVKRTLADGRGYVNAALFYIDYRDLQVSTFVSPGVIDASNAGHATSKGLEVEGAATLGRGLQLAGMLSWLDATYDRYDAFERGLGRVDASGKRLRNAPEWSGSGSAIYEMQIARGGRLTVRGDVSWQSQVFFTPLNRDVHSQPAYGLVHLRTAFEPRSRRWELAVYVRNVGRQEYVTATWDATGDLAISGRPGEPRHWGTQFTIRH